MKTMERPVLRTLEVIVSFDGAVLGVHHLRAGQGLRLGPANTAAATAPASRLGRRRPAQPDYALAGVGGEVALASHGAVPTVVFPAGAAGLVTLEGAATRTLGQLRDAGLCEAIEGGLRYALPAGAVCEISLGAFSARVSEAMLEGRTVPGSVPIDWRSHRFAAASLLLQGGVLGLAMLAPPDPRALASNDLSRLDNETLRTRYVPAVVELKLLQQPVGKDAGADAQKAVRGPAGHAGSPKVAADTRMAVTTVREARPPQRRGDDLRAEVSRSGVLAIMGTNVMRAALSNLTDASALGKDSDAVLTGLVASTDHLGWGQGGAHLMDSGTGPGGGCTGPDCGTVAVNLQGICDGGDCSSLNRSRTMRGPALPRTGHKAGAPDPTPGPIEVSGGLDKELVRRVIRSRMNEFKFCYERELVRAPELQGRVVMSFLIAKDGHVVSAVAKESTMASPPVHGCLSQAVQRLSFPMPQGSGLVQVSYPFVFHTAGK